MNCKVCNSPLTEGQSFCSYCGTKIEAPAEETTAVTEEIPAQETKTAEPVAETVTKNPPEEKTDETELSSEVSEKPDQESEEVVTEEIRETEEAVIPAQASAEAPADDDPRDKDAKTGFILGILAVAISCAGIPLGIIGLIKSTRGLKAPNKRIFGIIGTILSAAGILNFFTSLFSFISAIQSGMDLYDMLNMFVANLPW